MLCMPQVNPRQPLSVSIALHRRAGEQLNVSFSAPFVQMKTYGTTRPTAHPTAQPPRIFVKSHAI
jgi:hypothetical protein